MKFENIVVESKNNLYDLVFSELSKKYVKFSIMTDRDRISLGYDWDNEKIKVNIRLNQINDEVEIILDKIVIQIADLETENVNYQINIDNYKEERQKVSSDASVIAKTIHEMLKDQLPWMFEQLDKFVKEINKSADNIKKAVILK